MLSAPQNLLLINAVTPGLAGRPASKPTSRLLTIFTIKVPQGNTES